MRSMRISSAVLPDEPSDLSSSFLMRSSRASSLLFSALTSSSAIPIFAELRKEKKPDRGGGFTKLGGGREERRSEVEGGEDRGLVVGGLNGS